jgi:hypothetical protein
MNIPERAAQIAVTIANDDKHGYSQANRNGTLGSGDFDCSSLVIYCYDLAFREAGISPTPSQCGASYTGNMLAGFTRCGFKSFRDDHGAGLRVGDVLLNEQKHTAIVCSVNPVKVVNARGDLDGLPGDSSGTEIRIQSYWSFPWDWVLRYEGKSVSDPPQSNTVGQQMANHIIANRGRYSTIQFGDKGDAVMFAQAILVWLGYLNKGGKNFSNVDGDFGLLTKSATLGFQSSEKLEIDGIIGKNTWAALLKAIEE